MARKVPSITVDIIILGKDDSFVLVRRGTPPFKGYWAIPGGFVNYGEKVEEAAVREAKEETGLDVKLRKLVGVYSDLGRDPRGHIISICFLADETGGKLRKSPETPEVKRFKHIPQRLAFDHDKILRDAGLTPA